MAYSFGADSVGWGGASGSSATIATGAAITVALHDTVFIWLIVDGTRTFTAADNLGNTYTQIGAIPETSNGATAALFICRDATNGTCSPTVTINSATTNRSMVFGAISGLSTTLPLVSDLSNTAMNGLTDGDTSSLLTPLTQPAIVLGLMWNMYGNTVTEGTGYTVCPGGVLAKGFYFAAYLCSEHKRITSTSGVATTFTDAAGSTNGCVIAALIIPETGAAAPVFAVTYGGEQVGARAAIAPTIKVYGR